MLNQPTLPPNHMKVSIQSESAKADTLGLYNIWFCTPGWKLGKISRGYISAPSISPENQLKRNVQTKKNVTRLPLQQINYKLSSVFQLQTKF
jgi:hypothetical protein